MSSIPQKTEQNLFQPPRAKNVVMGRSDFLSVLLRLIGVELYKLRRRLMSKVLGSMSLFVMISVFALISIWSISIYFRSVESFLPPPCSDIKDPQASSCLNRPPTPIELEQAKLQKAEELKQASTSLLLPSSLTTAMQITRGLGLIFIIIVAGTIVGGEYTVGTIRLVLTRSPTRTQFLLAKMGAILVTLVLGVVLLVPLGIITGSIFAFIVQMTTDFGFLTGTWFLHAALYLLVSIFGLFTYGMLAICLSTLGRATAAGVAGALVWWVLEGIVGGLLSLAGALIKGPMGNVLKALPDYFIGNNVNALIQNQEQYLHTGQSSPGLSDLHALLVLAAYLIVFIGLSWWISERRDVTN